MNRILKAFIQLILVIAVLGAGALSMKVFVEGRPSLEKEAPKITVPIVRVFRVQAGLETVTISGEGTVRPEKQITLIPQVSGKIIEISPSLVNGGYFNKGQVLLRIEPADYQLALVLARSRVMEAESYLLLLEEESAAALEEWKLLRRDDDTLPEDPPPLLVKEPQLLAARSGLKAAGADLKKSELNLERTIIKAPFDGRVADENVDLGQFVSPGQPMATIYSTESVEIFLPLEDMALAWFSVPKFTTDTNDGSEAVIKAQVAGQEKAWSGRIVRAVGRLDERTRMIQVVVRVEDPFGSNPPLAPGQFVRVEIRGRSLSDAFSLPRAAVRLDNTVWVVDEKGVLRFQRVEIARRDGERAIVTDGLNDGEMVVISSIKNVTEGMNVKPNPINNQESK
jgi:RND family efflux transporter MFP subunit